MSFQARIKKSLRATRTYPDTEGIENEKSRPQRSLEGLEKVRTGLDIKAIVILVRVYMGYDLCNSDDQSLPPWEQSRGNKKNKDDVERQRHVPMVVVKQAPTFCGRLETRTWLGQLKKAK